MDLRLKLRKFQRRNDEIQHNLFTYIDTYPVENPINSYLSAIPEIPYPTCCKMLGFELCRYFFYVFRDFRKGMVFGVFLNGIDFVQIGDLKGSSCVGFWHWERYRFPSFLFALFSRNPVGVRFWASR